MPMVEGGVVYDSIVYSSPGNECFCWCSFDGQVKESIYHELLCMRTHDPIDHESIINTVLSHVTIKAVIDDLNDGECINVVLPVVKTIEGEIVYIIKKVDHDTVTVSLADENIKLFDIKGKQQ